MRRSFPSRRGFFVVLRLAVGLLSTVVAPQAWGASLALTTDPSYVGASAGLGAEGNVFESIVEIPLTSIPTPLGRLLARKNPGTAESVYALSSERVDFSFSLRRAPSRESYAASSLDLFFRTTSDVAFVLTGSMTAVDDEGRSTLFEVSLADRTTGSILFSSAQRSLSTPNETFLLGDGGGDEIDLRIGSPSGLLRTGRLYELIVGGEIRADRDATTFATATGAFSLVLVPEPSSAVLLGLGLLHLARSRDRRPDSV